VVHQLDMGMPMIPMGTATSLAAIIPTTTRATGARPTRCAVPAFTIGHRHITQRGAIPWAGVARAAISAATIVATGVTSKTARV
jgi:hypothetical protein